MALFGNQLQNVIEWNETRDDILFWKWTNKEIKKSSRLIIRPGQDAVFLYNGAIEGIFTDEGNYEIESQIIPFLSSLKGFRFGFNSGLRAEVLFVNCKEMTSKWGTKGPINIPSQALPGGIPIRSFGTFSVKICDYIKLIDKIAGVKQQFTLDDVKERITSVLDQMLMKWIVKEGRDMFNLQVNAAEIADGIKRDLDMEMFKIGLSITQFNIASFNYPDSVQKMIDKTASHSFVTDVDRYQKIGMTDALEKGSGGAMANGMGLAMGMSMANQMTQKAQTPATQTRAKFCTNCGVPVSEGSKFCAECGNRL